MNDYGKSYKSDRLNDCLPTESREFEFSRAEHWLDGVTPTQQEEVSTVIDYIPVDYTSSAVINDTITCSDMGYDSIHFSWQGKLAPKITLDSGYKTALLNLLREDKEFRVELLDTLLGRVE